jgi:hypothetical protein
MKTIIFSLLMILVLTGSLTFAQNSEAAKMSFGIIGGASLQNLNGKDAGGDKLTNTMIPGFHAGLNVQIPVAPQFYFQPGLMFSTKGAKDTFTVLGTTITQTTKLSYVEIPLNLVYKGALGNGFIMLGFGPYVGYAIGGKMLTKGGSLSQDNKITFKSTIETGDDPTMPYYKALDAGGNIFAGFQMASGIFAQLDTQLGLIKINPKNNRNSDDKSSVKNTGFGVSLGFRF